jgi:hypothetical protein
MKRLVLILLLLASTAQAQTFVALANPDLAAHVSFALGASWVDFDGDGDFDLYVTTGFAANNDNVLYRNDAGTLVRILGVPIVQDAADSPCSAWADWNNDGSIDTFVSNLVAQGGMLYTGTGGGALALDGAAGVTSAALKGTGCAFGDYDEDGALDLVVAALNGQGGIVTGNRLFHNRKDGTFEEVTSGPVVTTIDTHHHPTWADYDGDGDLDLFFATGPVGSTDTDRMYRNLLRETGAATFEPITTAPIATDLRDSQQLSWVDYDDDGDLDLYAVNYSSVGNQLYRNDGAGAFTKITVGTIVTDTGANHGVVWGDFDLDGDQDAYVVRDNGQSNRYYRNDGGGAFTRIASGAHVTEARSNYGAAAADYDGDGDLDLFVPTARSEGPSLLFRNDLANGFHWAAFRLRGTVANRSGLGAKVRVRAHRLWHREMADARAAQRDLLRRPRRARGALRPGRMRPCSTRCASSGREARSTPGRTCRPTRASSWWKAQRSWRAAPRVRKARPARLPNPARGGVRLAFTLPRAAGVRLSVADGAGRICWSRHLGMVAAGSHYRGDSSNAFGAPGVHLGIVDAEGRRTATRFVRLR